MNDRMTVATALQAVAASGDDTQPFEAGDVLFVAAGATHRFQDFSEDFGTWVVFTGPPA